MFFTGHLSNIGSYSVSLPWSGGAIWALLRPTSESSAISLWAPEVAVPFDLWNGGTLYLFCPYFNSSTCQTRAFSVVGPSFWNGLPLALRLLTRVHSDTVYSSHKTPLFSLAEVRSASE